MPPSSATSTAGAELDVDLLIADPAELFRERVLRAARVLIAERGLAVSMDEIADAAGVSRRSLFRHFDGRDALVAAALSWSLDWYNRQIEPSTGDEPSFDEWLRAVVTRIHQLHRSAGRGLWQLAAGDAATLPAELVAVDRRRRTNRRATTEELAREAWRRAGGRGPCPRLVIDAVALTISSFTTRSMVDDYGASVERLVDCTTALLAGLVRARVGGATKEGRRR
jgi:AcrR family transcriptional regulator